MKAAHSRSDVDVRTFLRAVLCDMAAEDLDDLAQAAASRTYASGATICQEGEAGHACFVIVSGEAEVSKHLGDETEMRLSLLGPGEFFGEMALVQEMVRAATVRALEPVTVLEIGRDAFLEVLGRSPSLAMRILAHLTARLRDTDQRTIIELRQVNDQLQEALDTREGILEISRELTTVVRLEPLLHKIVALAADLTGSESASILLLNEATGELRFRAASSDDGEQLRDITVPVEGSIAGAVLVSANPAIVADAHADERHYEFVGQQIGVDVHSLIAVPLRIKERNIGVLEAINKAAEEQFSREDVETLSALASQAAVAIANARLVEDLREASRRLSELDRMKSNFIAIASHELRTPLSLILGYAAVLRERLGSEAGPQLDAVLRAAMRLKQIIETMLNLRYLETGQVQLVREPFDLRLGVRNACGAYRSLAEANGLALEMRVPAEPLVVVADRDKIQLVLENLLSNAVKFTPGGGRVRVTAVQRGDQAEFAVSDTGVGIAQEALGYIFERFRQEEDHMTRRHGGMGLGLPIVRGLVELHGGRVWAESVVGRGSRFVVQLPTTAPAGRAAPKTAGGP